MANARTTFHEVVSEIAALTPGSAGAVLRITSSQSRATLSPALAHTRSKPEPQVTVSGLLLSSPRTSIASGSAPPLTVAPPSCA